MNSDSLIEELETSLRPEAIAGGNPAMLLDRVILIIRRHYNGKSAIEGKPLELQTRDELLAHIRALQPVVCSNGWQPKHEWHRYGIGIVRSKLLEDHVYFQGKNGDVWRVMLEMDGMPSIECIEKNAILPAALSEGGKDMGRCAIKSPQVDPAAKSLYQTEQEANEAKLDQEMGAKPYMGDARKGAESHKMESSDSSVFRPSQLGDGCNIESSAKTPPIVELMVEAIKPYLPRPLHPLCEDSAKIFDDNRIAGAHAAFACVEPVLREALSAIEAYLDAQNANQILWAQNKCHSACIHIFDLIGEQ